MVQRRPGLVGVAPSFLFLSGLRSPTLLHLENPPPLVGWSFQLPRSLEGFWFEDQWLEKLTRYNSVSVHLKSTVDRARLYLASIFPRLGRLRFQESNMGPQGRLTWVRGSVSSSYAGSNSKKHKVYLELQSENLEIPASCSCKAGQSAKCAHVACVFLRLRFMGSEVPEQKKTKGRKISESYHRLIQTHRN